MLPNEKIAGIIFQKSLNRFIIYGDATLMPGDYTVAIIYMYDIDPSNLLLVPSPLKSPTGTPIGPHFNTIV